MIKVHNEKNQNGKSELISNWSPQLTFFLEVIVYQLEDTEDEELIVWESGKS